MDRCTLFDIMVSMVEGDMVVEDGMRLEWRVEVTSRLNIEEP